MILNLALMKFLISETFSYELNENFPIFITGFALFVKLYTFEYYIKLDIRNQNIKGSRTKIHQVQGFAFDALIELEI